MVAVVTVVAVIPAGTSMMIVEVMTAEATTAEAMTANPTVAVIGTAPAVAIAGAGGVHQVPVTTAVTTVTAEGAEMYQLQNFTTPRCTACEAEGCALACPWHACWGWLRSLNSCQAGASKWLPGAVQGVDQ